MPDWYVIIRKARALRETVASYVASLGLRYDPLIWGAWAEATDWIDASVEAYHINKKR